MDQKRLANNRKEWKENMEEGCKTNLRVEYQKRREGYYLRIIFKKVKFLEYLRTCSKYYFASIYFNTCVEYL